jgi:predicted transcriptional regulator
LVHTISIGVIGPNIIVDQIKDAIKGFPNFTPIFMASDNIYDAPLFAQELAGKVEVLLFSGYLPYKLAKEKVDFIVPAHYIPLKGTGLFRALYRLKNKIKSFGELSIDTLSPQEVETVLEEIGESVEDIHYIEDSSLELKEKIVRFHKEKFEQGLCEGALTGIKVVSEALTELNIPNEWVIPTQQDIIVSLERALLSTEKRRNKESQIVFGIISIDKFNHLIHQKASEHEVQKLKLDIYRLFLDYVECLDGHLTNLGGEEYLFVTTRGIFERVTKGYKTIPILKNTKAKIGVSISIGIGFGLTANEAGTHARIALRQSQESGGNICYIVREDRSVIGPVEMTNPLVYELSITDKILLERAEKAGMTATYLSKILAQVNRSGKDYFTAQELAEILTITVRSANRILLQWLDAKLVEIAGVEKVTSKGRPRQIYNLTFTHHEKELVT